MHITIGTRTYTVDTAADIAVLGAALSTPGMVESQHVIQYYASLVFPQRTPEESAHYEERCAFLCGNPAQAGSSYCSDECRISAEMDRR